SFPTRRSSDLEEELRHAREHRERAPRDGDRALVPRDDDLAVAEEAGAHPVIRVRHERLEGERACRGVGGGADARDAAEERLARIWIDADPHLLAFAQRG